MTFFIKVEKIIGLVKLETGEKLTMPEDYLAAGGILPEATEVGKRACEKEPKVPEAPLEIKTHSDNATSKPSKMKRPHGGSPLKCRMVALGKLHEEVVRHARSETVSIVTTMSSKKISGKVQSYCKRQKRKESRIYDSRRI